jgi:hypothetical protein
MHSLTVPRLTERFVVHLLGAFICSAYCVTHEALADPADAARPAVAPAADRFVAAGGRSGMALKLEHTLAAQTGLALAEATGTVADRQVAAAPAQSAAPVPARTRAAMFPELAKVAMANHSNMGPLPILGRDEMVLSEVESTANARTGKPAAATRAAGLSLAAGITAAPPVATAAGTEAKPAMSAWEVRTSDKTLNGTFARWAAAAGWQLVWELPVDYAVQVRGTIPGTLEEAVGVVAQSMQAASVPLKAIFYEGNKVLRIVAKGSE